MGTFKNSIKSRLGAGVLACSLLFSMVVGLKATEKKEVVEEKEDVNIPFHYASELTSEGAFADPANWQEGPSPNAQQCGTGENKPCETLAADQASLASMLSGRSNSEVLDIVDSTRD